MLQLLLLSVSIFVVSVGTYRGIEYFRERFDISPVDSFDVEGLLRKHNLWTAFNNSQIKCAGCGESITFSNLGTIAETVDSHILEMICKKPLCHEMYIQSLEAELWDKSEAAS